MSTERSKMRNTRDRKEENKKRVREEKSKVYSVNIDIGLELPLRKIITIATSEKQAIMKARNAVVDQLEKGFPLDGREGFIGRDWRVSHSETLDGAYASIWKDEGETA